MSSLSENQIIEILSEVYSVDKKYINRDVIKYFRDVATTKIISAIKRTPKGIPYNEILENSENIEVTAKKYGVSSDMLRKRLKEYQVITEGFECN